jgi:four helix bundle protein
MPIAHPSVMAATRYEELEAWRDRHFCDQLRDSASSAPANLAEGFAYYDHPEFARHVRIAKASLDETHNHLQDGVDREFWNEVKVAPLLKLASDAALSTQHSVRR